MFDFLGCSIAVPPEQMSAIVRTESSAHPFAIGVVGHYLSRQPASVEEANQMVRKLKEGSHNYSVGIAQVNQVNFKAYGLNESNMFDVCTNLSAGSRILKSCFDQYQDWGKAYSCYYSGNAITGFRHGYVRQVKNNFEKPLLTDIKSVGTHTSEIKLLPHKKGGALNLAANKPMSLKQRRLSSTLSSI